MLCIGGSTGLAERILCILTAFALVYGRPRTVWTSALYACSLEGSGNTGRGCKVEEVKCRRRERFRAGCDSGNFSSAEEYNNFSCHALIPRAVKRTRRDPVGAGIILYELLYSDPGVSRTNTVDNPLGRVKLRKSRCFDFPTAVFQPLPRGLPVTRRNV